MVSCAGKEEAQAHKRDRSDDEPPDAYRHPVIWKHNPVADDRARDTKDHEPNDPGRGSGHGSSAPLNQKPHKENAAETSKRPLRTSGHAVFPNLRLICGRIARKQHHGKIGNSAVVFLGTHPYMARYGRGEVHFAIMPRHGPEDHGPNIQTDARPATERNCIGDR